jgi:hypothetical protein
LYRIISYLTHSHLLIKADFPGLSFEELEDFVIQHSDIRLIVGFFFYAVKHHCQPAKVEEWTAKLFDCPELYAISLFLTTLTFSYDAMPAFLMKFVRKHLEAIGYFGFSVELLDHAFRRESGMKWFFIRSVISIDKNAFASRPLLLAEFVEQKDLPPLFEQFFRELTGPLVTDKLTTCYVTLVSILFRPQQVVQISTWPIAHRSLYNIPIHPVLPPPFRIEKKLISIILSGLEKATNWPVLFIPFFFALALHRSDQERILRLVSPRGEYTASFFRHLFPAVYFRSDAPVFDDNARLHFGNRPPSFGLAFYRSVLSFCAPPLPQTLIVEVENVLCPIHPEFAYLGLRPWPNITDGTKLQIGLMVAEPLAELRTPGREAIAVYHALMTRHIGRGDAQARIEGTLALLQTAVSEAALSHFAAAVCSAVVKYEREVVVEAAKAVVEKSENFLNLALIAKKLARGLGDPALLQDMRGRIGRRSALLDNCGTLEGVDALIHRNFDDL